MDKNKKTGLWGIIISSLVLPLFLFTFIGCSDDDSSSVEISLNKEELFLEIGKSERLIASFNPFDAPNQAHRWFSSNNQIASVDETGNVTAINTGNAVIMAKALDGGSTAKCNVTVVDKIIPVTSVSLDVTECEIAVGDQMILNASVKPANASNQKIKWVSEDISIATVDSEGNVEAVSMGTVNVKAISEDGGKTAICNVSVVSKGVRFSTPEIENITSNAALVIGTAKPVGVEITEMGICYATEANPTVDDEKIALTNTSISYNVKGLNPETTYYVRLYAIADGKVTYSNQTVFETLTTVSFSSPKFSDVSSHSVVVKGTISSNGSELSETGFVYSKKQEPTINDNKVSISKEEIEYTLFDLEPNTSYYVRLYAIVGGKEYYSEEVEFTTKEELLTNFMAKRIFEDRLELESEVPEGYETVKVCYGTTPNPEVTDYTAVAKVGSDGKLRLVLSNLVGRKYYIRSYEQAGSSFKYSDDEVCVETIFKVNAQYNPNFESESTHVMFRQSWSGYPYEVYNTITYKNFPEGTYEVLSSTYKSKGINTGWSYGVGWGYGYTKDYAYRDNLNHCTKNLAYINGGDGVFYHIMERNYWDYINGTETYYITFRCLETGVYYFFEWKWSN